MNAALGAERISVRDPTALFFKEKDSRRFVRAGDWDALFNRAEFVSDLGHELKVPDAHNWRNSMVLCVVPSNLANSQLIHGQTLAIACIESTVLLLDPRMAGEPTLPSFSDAQVLKALREAAARGLDQTRQAAGDVFDSGYDMQGVNELIADCEDAELHESVLSDNYPQYQDWIAILKVPLEGERKPFYVKVALSLPDLRNGELMSFHPWGMQR